MSKSQIVVDYIKSQINDNKLKLGEKIPTEKELGSLLNLSHTTIRNGLKILADEKIIVTKQGSGSYINNQLKDTILILISEFSIFDTINNFHIEIINNLKEEISKKNYIPSVFIDKKNEGFSQNINYEKLAGVICLSGMSFDLKVFEEKNIPIVSMPPKYIKYPTVCLGNDSLYNNIIGLIKKYNFENSIIIFYKFNFEVFNKDIQNDPINYIKNNYNYLEIPYTSNRNFIKNKIIHYIENLEDTPGCICFLDNTIYQIAQTIFDDYEDIFKNTKIITHSNNYEVFPSDYKICRFSVNVSDFTNEIIDLIFKLINNERILSPTRIIQAQIIDEHKLI